MLFYSCEENPYFHVDSILFKNSRSIYNDNQEEEEKEETKKEKSLSLAGLSVLV
jgi:hypothetical protein